MATAAVSTVSFLLSESTDMVQNPPLYLHVTSTSKQGLEQAVAKIEELMQQELPNLVDERRFRRREPEQVERDEFGRVSSNQIREETLLTPNSVNGQRRRFLLTLNPFLVSTFVLRLLVMAVFMSSISNKKLGVVYRSRDVVLDSWSMALAKKVMSPCTCMLRRF